MIKKIYLLTILVLSFFSSCRRDLDEKELTKYITNPAHGLVKESNINGLRVQVLYKPQDMLIKQQFGTKSTYGTDTITKLKSLFYKQLYFKVSFSVNNKELLNSLAPNQVKYAEILNQLAFGMSEKVTLVTSERDTLEMADYIFPRTFGIANSTDLLFAFQNKNLKNASWVELKIEDFGLEMHDVRFTFFLKDIKKIPHLIIK